MKPSSYTLAVVVLLFHSCTTPGPAGLFGKKSPHESYSDKITNAGLKETALGRSWFNAAEQSLSKAVNVTIPYSEKGYFSAEKAEAAGIRFKATRGEKLNIQLTKKPATGFSIYMDLWQFDEGETRPKWLVAADTSNSKLSYEVRKDGQYILRLQPELLAAGEYDLTISSGPSLAFPVPAKAKPRIASFWGASRDNGGRRHEGIDIFAPRRTPVVAAADGTVTSVSENNLGGKVVFFRPHQKDYTLYYAHLDEQLVSQGQTLKTGDTLGLMGNTGNARTTSPHLHFGIYTNGGAIDPLPFVNPVDKTPAKITAPLLPVGKVARVENRSQKLYGEPSVTPSNYVTVEGSTTVRVLAATKDWYKIVLPNGQQGYIRSNVITSLNNPIRRGTVRAGQAVLDAPTTEAARKVILEKPQTVEVLGLHNDFYYVSVQDEEGWIPKASITAK